MAQLVDGGARTDFGTGAVREPAEGKGRCDLLQLNEIAEFYDTFGCTDLAEIFRSISLFIYEHKNAYLYKALNKFAQHIGAAPEELWMMDALQMEDGANKYAARNWENGIPTARYIDSAVRHLLKYIIYEQNNSKWNDEPHDRAFIWNILCAAWNMNYRTDLNNLPINSNEQKNLANK